MFIFGSLHVYYVFMVFSQCVYCFCVVISMFTMWLFDCSLCVYLVSSISVCVHFDFSMFILLLCCFSKFVMCFIFSMCIVFIWLSYFSLYVYVVFSMLMLLDLACFEFICCYVFILIMCVCCSLNVYIVVSQMFLHV